MSIRCLIFDLDGTLVDSEPLCSQAFLDLLPDLDDDVDGLMRRYRGRRMSAVLADLSVRLGRPLDDDFETRYRARVAALYDHRLLPMPGVVTALAALDDAVCVASNGPVAKMRHGLRAAGLAGFFGDNLFSAYDIGHWKPEPHLFLHAAQRMGFPPQRCVVLEDSEVGIEAGRAAGMQVIRFRHAGDEADGADAAWSISHFGELESVLGCLAA